MQASTRIGIALCVLVAGATMAGLFRKLPEPVVSPADRSESSLTLRQPGPAPVMAAGATAEGWRSTAAEASTAKKASADKDRGHLPGNKVAERGPVAPP